MRLKAIPLHIPVDDPFKEDKLSRKPVVEMFAELLSAADEPLVLSINSPWGTGKTTFLRMLKVKLQADGFVCIHMNAWETDFSQDALNALTNELAKGLMNEGETAKQAESLKKLKSAAAGILKIGLPIALRITTGAVLPLPAEVGGGLGELLSKYAEAQIGAYEKAKSAIVSFKKKLEAFAEAAYSDSDKKPVVILIDDLDRCKPSYALKMLEAAKHFFDVRGFVFILAVDPKQMRESVRAIYGGRIDAKEYLRRFVDLEYVLPLPSIKSYCESLFGRFDMEPYFEKRRTANTLPMNDRADFLNSCAFLFTTFNLSLRAQEQCFTHLALVLRSTPPGYLLYPVVVAVLLTIRTHDLSTYDKIVAYEMSPADIVQYLKSAPKAAVPQRQVPREDELRLDYSYVEAMFALALDGEKFRSSEYEKWAKDTNRGIPAMETAKRIVSILNSLSIHYSHAHDVMGYISRKIELTDKFVVK
jgi:hypothetical protein